MENSQKKELINYLLSESHLIDTSDQYFESVLKEYGYNNDQLKAEGSELVAKLFLKAKAQSAKAELMHIISNAKAKLAKLKTIEDNTLARMQELFDRKYATRYALNFRDLKQMDEKDALSILSDVEILDFLNNQKIDDDKVE